MSFSQERLELIRTRLVERLEEGGLSEWERSFLADMQVRFERYGMRTRLSDRQDAKLHSLLGIGRDIADDNAEEVIIDMSAARQQKSPYRPKRKQTKAYNKAPRYYRSKRTPTIRQVIYGPKRAIRKAQRLLVISAIIGIGIMALIDNLFSPTEPSAGAGNTSYQTQSASVSSSTLYVTGGSVNQRDGPSTSARVLGALPKGTPVKGHQTQNGWVKVTSPLGTGWMSARYLSGQMPSVRSVKPSVSRGALRASDIRVIDGDTIAISGERANTRLVGFNTPELSSAACSAEQALGRKATSRLTELINSASSLQFERVTCSCRPGTQGTKSCNYGRGCGTLRVDGHDVGRLLIAEGLAVRYICGPTRCPPRPGNWCQ